MERQWCRRWTRYRGGGGRGLPPSGTGATPHPTAEFRDVVYIQTLGLSPVAQPPRGETPRMGLRRVVAQAACPSPNEWMEQTGAHPALGGHQRPQRAGCSSAVVRPKRDTVSRRMLFSPSRGTLLGSPGG
jgi:hypothetical protein